MPFTDLPLDQLRDYAPSVPEPGGFDEFWTTTVAEARAHGGGGTVQPADTPITQFVVEDLTFSGFGGEPVKGWITRPVSAVPLPTVVEFIGYNGGRGVPGERLQWAAAGFVHVLMDTRGQGSGWGTGGDTPDPHGSGPSVAGFMTRGIHDRAEYYYRRLFTDGVRLVDAVLEMPFVDRARVAVTGSSQGGGISLAVAALHEGVCAVLPDVPFLCNFRRSVELTPTPPFTEIERYLAVHRGREEQTFDVLSYFDGVNFARRIRVPAYFSVALMDGVVLPSTVFSAYNVLGSTDKQIEVYPFNGHEGGQHFHWARQAAWLRDRL